MATARPPKIGAAGPRICMMPRMSEDLSLLELAGEFLAGTLPDDDLGQFETRLLEDPEAKQAVDLWERRMAAFLGRNANAALHAQRKGRNPAAGSAQDGPPPGESPKAWSALAPGVTGMALHYDHLVGSMVYIARLEPGARCPTAEEGSPEDCLLVSGDFSLDEVTLRAGDDHHAPASVIHSGGSTEAGAVMLIRARDV